MRISHDAIYLSIFTDAERSSVSWCGVLRTESALRSPREHSKRAARAPVTAETLISERPVEVAGRSVPGHWEPESHHRVGRSAIGCVVERTSRLAMLVHLPREEGHAFKGSTKKGPALSGYAATTMKNALTQYISTLHGQVKKSLTWDRGKRLSDRAQFTIETGIPAFFQNPKSPRQRGTNENTNGLLRQYFPKGTDLAR